MSQAESRDVQSPVRCEVVVDLVVLVPQLNVVLLAKCPPEEKGKVNFGSASATSRGLI